MELTDVTFIHAANQKLGLRAGLARAAAIEQIRHHAGEGPSSAGQSASQVSEHAGQAHPFQEKFMATAATLSRSNTCQSLSPAPAISGPCLAACFCPDFPEGWAEPFRPSDHRLRRVAGCAAGLDRGAVVRRHCSRRRTLDPARLPRHDWRVAHRPIPDRHQAPCCPASGPLPTR